MNKIAVITAVVGLKELSLYPPTYKNADYFIFSDLDLPKHDVWNVRKLYPAFIDKEYENRRTGKIPKIIPHYLLPDYEYFIWHDYTHYVKLDPQTIVDTYLKDHDLAFFKHPHRKCWYEELVTVRMASLDNKDILDQQKEFYERTGVKKKQDFYECTCFVRRNNEVANKVCSLWYDHVSKFSSRDQLSLPAAIQAYNPRVNVMEGTCQMYYGNNKIIPQYRHSLRLQKLVK